MIECTHNYRSMAYTMKVPDRELTTRQRISNSQAASTEGYLGALAAEMMEVLPATAEHCVRLATAADPNTRTKAFMVVIQTVVRNGDTLPWNEGEMFHTDDIVQKTEITYTHPDDVVSDESLSFITLLLPK
tara:strand:+ start:744 stop:1136 length:393 start_codon:yes stop_codon:yes gene_type:complete